MKKRKSLLDKGVTSNSEGEHNKISMEKKQSQIRKKQNAHQSIFLPC
jgi:hypothetical protein